MQVAKKNVFLFRIKKTKGMSNRNTINWSALFSSNFLGVFNDNLLKNSIIFFAISWKLPLWLNTSQLISLVSAALIVPYLLFSPYAGNLSVKFSKRSIFLFFKLIEIPIMVLASIAFVTESVYLAIFTVLLMGIQSSLYSPAKYSLIRDIGGEKKVAFGSGMFETMAFMGILGGTVVASVLSDFTNTWVLIAIFIATAIVGYFSTSLIKVQELPVKDQRKSINPFVFFYQAYKIAKRYKGVNAAVIGSSVFWLIGGMLQMNLVIHSKNAFNASNTETGFIMAIAAIAIAIGCFVAAKIAGHSAGQKLMLPGMAGMILFLGLLSFFDFNIEFYTLCVFGVAFSGGFFQVPCLATIQKSKSGRLLGDLIAYLNLSTFVFVSLGTFLFWIITYFTNQNSQLVFVVLWIISIITFYSFNKYFKQKKRA